MIDHIGLHVSALPSSLEVYGRALAALGYAASADDTALVKDGEPTISLYPAKHPTRMHLAFKAASRAIVDEFYAAVIEAGAGDNGPPSIRDDYRADYYAAFVVDPDGNNLETVYMSETV